MIFANFVVSQIATELLSYSSVVKNIFHSLLILRVPQECSIILEAANWYSIWANDGCSYRSNEQPCMGSGGGMVWVLVDIFGTSEELIQSSFF